MIKLTLQAIRQTIVWSIIAGMVYPLVFTVFAQLVFPKQANGSLVMRDGKLVGSEWMAQQFQGAKYFWPRPSAATYGTGASGLAAGSGSNLGPTSAQLQTNVRTNAKAAAGTVDRQEGAAGRGGRRCRCRRARPGGPGLRVGERRRPAHQPRGCRVPGRPRRGRARDARGPGAFAGRAAGRAAPAGVPGPGPRQCPPSEPRARCGGHEEVRMTRRPGDPCLNPADSLPRVAR